MICRQCIVGKCKKCVKRNATKDYSDCDCQHRGSDRLDSSHDRGSASLLDEIFDFVGEFFD